MSERNRAAIHIYALRIKMALLNHRQRLRGEGFVQFNYINVGELESRQSQRLGNREHRAESHFLRLVSGGGEGNIASERLGFPFPRPLPSHHDPPPPAHTRRRRHPPRCRYSREQRAVWAREPHMRWA